MFQRMNDIRLRNKMVIVFILAVFIPVVLTNVIFFNLTTSSVKKQKLADINRGLEQIRNEVDDQIESAVGISTVLYNDTLLNEYIERQYSNQSDYVENYHTYMINLLDKYSPVYEAIQAVTIYSTNDTILYGGRVQKINSHVREQNWYKSVMSKLSAQPALERNDPEYPGLAPNTLSIIRKMVDSGVNGSAEKLIKIDMHPQTIREMLQNVTLEGTVYLIRDNEIQYSSDPKQPLNDGSGRSIRYDQPDSSGDMIVLEKDFGNVTYLEGWKIVGEFKEREVLEDVNKSKLFVVYMSIANILVPTLILVWFTRSLSDRLVRILKQMKRVKNHSFETINDPPSADEIGQLTEEFNRMTRQIKSLIDDVYIADIQKKELQLSRNQSQLHALQSQINPHFLFNSLETIRMRSLMKDELETAKIIHNMAKIFRKSLSWGKDWITLKDELDLVACFLEIQKYRFGDKLNYTIHADEGVLSTMIPKMTLQPLVENASIHGIEPLKEAGWIHIHIERRATGLAYTIKDNGVGIPQEKLTHMLAGLDKDDAVSDNVGMRNVYLRFKGFYGDKADFQIKSEPGQGTEITIVIAENNDI